eukprot:CAMPEP_0118905148 /NCGR_PEP_ID=MMETSP1166-20130328/9301_1 /TAXON_ID=1104430 /ORGANISM="Chrysoreinhardia sp, Strain CCMP3193" /LENGTH=594 /DNA_ID=CAMNT_0006844417 /DNA_START=17 /DNA_END=1801 /DNA_ORIENTATION=+
MKWWLLTLPWTMTFGFVAPPPGVVVVQKKKKMDTTTARHAMADLLRDVKVDIPWLVEGEAPKSNKENVPAHIASVLEKLPRPRVPESAERIERIRRTAAEAAAVAELETKKSAGDEWWRSRDRRTPELRVLVAGGGLAGLCAAAACEAKGMKVAVFEQATKYAPYGGPIQIQSNALRAIEKINRKVFEELLEKGTPTADRVSGLKIGYKRGNKLAGFYDRGDWLVRFDTIGPALEAGLPPTVVVDRPVIQQIFVTHGLQSKNTVQIASRVASYVERDDCVEATLADGTVVYGDVLVGADGIWSTVRHQLDNLDETASGAAITGAAGGALDDKEAATLNREAVKLARQAHRRYSGFTCYAGLCEHKASNIEDVSYQILLGSSKYFVSTDAGGDRQQWFALIREDPGGVDQEPSSANDFEPKKRRLAEEFAFDSRGDADGNVWDPFAMELIDATPEAQVKRRDLYDGHPLARNPRRWLTPWNSDRVALAGDAAHPMMPNLGQGGCQSTEDAFRLAEELAECTHDPADNAKIADALARYSRRRLLRTATVQGLAQLGSDLLVDFDLMMTIPILGPAFLLATQLSMPWILRFLYLPKP